MHKFLVAALCAASFSTASAIAQSKAEKNLKAAQALAQKLKIDESVALLRKTVEEAETLIDLAQKEIAAAENSVRLVTRRSHARVRQIDK